MKGLKTEGNYDKFIQSLDELRKLLEQLFRKRQCKKNETQIHLMIQLKIKMVFEMDWNLLSKE